jgi:hypothetical protein
MDDNLKVFNIRWAELVDFTLTIDISIWTADKLHEYLAARGLSERVRSDSSGMLYFLPSQLIPVFLELIWEDLVSALMSAGENPIQDAINRLNAIDYLPRFDGSEGLKISDVETYSPDEEFLSITELEN